ncbi:MAG TPA: hypothetical protein VF848_09395 [Steroidobacteraceae bacterium]
MDFRTQTPNPTAFAVAALLPSSLLLLYLALHATEGWQLLVVAAFLAGFIVSWRRRSIYGLTAAYAAAIALSAWVAWVNLGLPR